MRALIVTAVLAAVLIGFIFGNAAFSISVLADRIGGVNAFNYRIASTAIFVLLAMVDDKIRFDGFECFRVQDLRDVKPEPHAAFVEAALRKRGERLPLPRRL